MLVEVFDNGGRWCWETLFGECTIYLTWPLVPWVRWGHNLHTWASPWGWVLKSLHNLLPLPTSQPLPNTCPIIIPFNAASLTPADSHYHYYCCRRCWPPLSHRHMPAECWFDPPPPNSSTPSLLLQCLGVFPGGTTIKFFYRWSSHYSVQYFE